MAHPLTAGIVSTAWQPSSVDETRHDQEHYHHRTHAIELETIWGTVRSKLTHPMTVTSAPATEGHFLLTINGGSSSIKFGAFDRCGPLRRILHGEMTGIGSPHANLKVNGASQTEKVSRDANAPDHAAAVGVIMDYIDGRFSPGRLTAIGHRVVHGGPKYSAPVRITPDVIMELREVGAYDPEHMPEEIELIEALGHRFPSVPQIACFDTAFHHDMPRVARTLPIPRRYEAQGLRRFGFHGLSYEYLVGEISRVAGPDPAQGRMILAHLGSGASLAAVHAGKSIDTSMGLTPAAGVPMSTRSGDLDPGLGGYLFTSERMTPAQFNKMANFESGLLGISETSSDMRVLIASETSDERAADAVALFCYQTRKWIGAFAAALGGLETLVFAGGIGENSPIIRARICNKLGFLGIKLCVGQNENSAAVISQEGRPVTVRVIATDEQRMIARHVITFLNGASELPPAEQCPTQNQQRGSDGAAN